MDMKVFYFTGTGNSLQVARGVGAYGKLISIPYFLREHKGDPVRLTVLGETIGLVFPTYWLAVPPLVVEFLEKVRFETDYLFAIVTRGNASLTLKSQLLHVARRNGHDISYYNQLSMPDNWLPLCDMAKEKLRFTEAELSRQIDAMAADIRSHRKNTSGHAALSFLRPAVVSLYASRQIEGFTQRFSVDASCSGCSTCVQVCSAQSIALQDGAPVFSTVCNGCLACVHNCSTGAIHMRNEKSSERYRNPNVSLLDIISASSSREPVST